MHAMQTLCKLSCSRAKVGQRLIVSSGSSLCQIEHRPSFSAASSAGNTAVLTPSKVVQQSQTSSTWSRPLRMLAATTMAAVAWLVCIAVVCMHCNHPFCYFCPRTSGAWLHNLMIQCTYLKYHWIGASSLRSSSLLGSAGTPYRERCTCGRHWQQGL